MNMGAGHTTNKQEMMLSPAGPSPTVITID